MLASKISSSRAALAVIAGLCVCIVAADRARADEGVRGVVKARNEAVLSVGFMAQVAEISARSGERFEKGDTLIAFDCAVQEAEADAAAAAYRSQKAQYENNREMKAFDAIGQFDLRMSKADMEEAGAKARAARARTKNCVLKAPYGGAVAELAVNEHETPSADQPLMKIVDMSDLELRLIAPSDWLQWLEPGVAFEFEIDETRARKNAHVKTIGAEIDAVSKTISVIAIFTSSTEGILPGMSGTAYFPQAVE
ncbi:MAG: efflux RND transporter periplasmic adaptor subunit [Pseudomonadota bacterium]